MPMCAHPNPIKIGNFSVAINDDVYRQTWRPDGKLLPTYFAPKMGILYSGVVREGSRTLHVDLRLKKKSDAPVIAFRFEGVPLGSSELVGNQTTIRGRLIDGENVSLDSDVWVGSIVVQPTQFVANNIDVGTATGPWRTVGSYQVQNGKFSYVSGIRFNPRVKSSDKNAKFITLTTEMPRDNEIHTYQLTVTNDQGKAALLAGSSGKAAPANLQESYWSGLGVNEVRTIKLQARTFRWTQIKNIRWYPIRQK